LRVAARFQQRTLATLVVSTCLVLSLPLNAEASYRTLARSVSNMLFGPLDIALSPIVAFKGEIEKMQDVDDTTGVRVAYAVPGYFFYTGVVIGAGVIRTVTGALELVPGIVLLPFKTDMDPLMTPVADAPALFEYENEYFPVRFGLDYTSAD
jgi:hypothetical protein